MAYKFTYLTVQHSGTRFLERYFIHIGFSPKRLTRKCLICNESHGYEKHMPEKNMSGRYEYTWNHYSDYLTKELKTYSGVVYDFESYPVVSTLRHPYKTAISFLSRGHDLRNCVNMWENFIQQSFRTPIIFFDVDCVTSYRKSHLLDIVRKIDCYDNETEDLTEEFVNEWKLVGVYNSDIKIEYEEAGKLPDVFNWSRFDRAVNWYNKTIGKVRDNITS